MVCTDREEERGEETCQESFSVCLLHWKTVLFLCHDTHTHTLTQLLRLVLSCGQTPTPLPSNSGKPGYRDSILVITDSHPKSGRVDGCCGNQVKCHVRLWWMLLQTVTPAVTTGHIRRRGQETIIFKNFTPSVRYTCSISLHQTDMFCCNPTGLPLAREDGPFFFFGPKQNITPHYPKLVYTPITHHIKITDRFCE